MGRKRRPDEEGSLSYRQPADVWAVTTARLSQSAKVRVCVELLKEQLREGPHALVNAVRGQAR